MIKGIFAPIPTPFDENEAIAYDRLAANLERWFATDLTGVVVLGSNGEYVLLTTEEKRELISFVCRHAPAGRPVIAGTGGESTREAIELSRHAADCGAAAALVITPAYYKGAMTDAALAAHFTAVADASPIPVMLYNMPRNTGINMSSKLVIELSKHPNIAGIKDSGGNIVQIAEIIAGVRPDFAVFAGSGSFLYPTLALGGVGGTLAVANVIPNECARILRLVEAGEHDEARRLQLAILEINNAVTGKYGVGGLKAALDLLGYYGGNPRRPIQPAKPAERDDLRRMLAGLGYQV
ncbi:MAG: dihydrodipicolinate synthase family protein [Chloroflexota bacterium]